MKKDREKQIAEERARKEEEREKPAAKNADRGESLRFPAQ